MSHVMRNLLMPYANNKGADQPAHPRSRNSAFVVRFRTSVISILAKSKIARLQLVSEAEQAGLSYTCSQTLEDRLSHDVAHIAVLFRSAMVVFWQWTQHKSVEGWQPILRRYYQ